MINTKCLVSLKIQTVLIMIVLLECLTVILESIDLFLVCEMSVSPTLKTPLYIIFTTQKCGISCNDFNTNTYVLICLSKFLA